MRIKFIPIMTLVCVGFMAVGVAWMCFGGAEITTMRIDHLVQQEFAATSPGAAKMAEGLRLKKMEEMAVEGTSKVVKLGLYGGVGLFLLLALGEHFLLALGELGERWKKMRLWKSVE